MKNCCIHILLLFPFIAFGADVTHEGMFVSMASHSIDGDYEFYDSVVPNGGGRISSTTSGVEMSLNDLIDRFAVNLSALVRYRFVFYNNSFWDGNNVLANAADDMAIDSNKVALETLNEASFINYTSYPKGLNGVIMDFSKLAKPSSITAADFDFRIGNSEVIDSVAPAPVELAVRELSNGLHRVTVIFPDGEILNQWLKITVLANANTGLEAADVFYFGNAVGSAGSFRTTARVRVKDVEAVSNQIGSASTVNSSYDIDRSGTVDIEDALISFNSITGIEPTEETVLLLADIAAAYNLPEDRLEFALREALALFRVEMEAVSTTVNIIWLPTRDLYVEVDNQDLLLNQNWVLYHTATLGSESWIQTEGSSSFEPSGKGWLINAEDLPDAIFFRAQLSE